MHSIAAKVLASKSTPDHAERHLRPIAEGPHIATGALSEMGIEGGAAQPERQPDRE